MAERKGPGRYPEGNGDAEDPGESDRQDGRSDVADERGSAAVEGTADEGTEQIDTHRDLEPAADSRSLEAETTDDRVLSESDSAGAAGMDTESGGSAQVVAFRQRNAGSDGAENLAAVEDLLDPEELDDFGGEPVDLSALQADDALLDALGGTNPDVPSASGDDGPDLESLLVAWRRDVDAAPIGDLVETDDAVAAISEGRRRQRRLKRRHLVPVASAAAVLMIAFTGVGLAARDALPGDMLWGVAQVFYTDNVRSAQAASAARGELTHAEQAWDDGKGNTAESALKRARDQMQAVDSDDGLSDLERTHTSLAAKFERATEAPKTSSSKRTTVSESHPTTTTQLPPSMPPPPPPMPLPPPPPPTHTTPSTPSSSPQPSEPTTSPSETSGSSAHPSSGGSTWQQSSQSGLFAPRP